VVRPIVIRQAMFPVADWFAAFVAQGLEHHPAIDRAWAIGYGTALLDGDRAQATRIWHKLAASGEERQVALTRLSEFKTAARIGWRPGRGE
jgi:hypothetical protein